MNMTMFTKKHIYNLVFKNIVKYIIKQNKCWQQKGKVSILTSARTIMYFLSKMTIIVKNILIKILKNIYDILITSNKDNKTTSN